MNTETNHFLANPVKWLKQGNRSVLLALTLVVAGMIAAVVIGNLPEKKMCRLFDSYSPTFAERNRILAALGATEFTDYCEENEQLMVPVDQKSKILAVIADKGAMPERLLKEPELQLNPFLPRSQLEQLRLAQKTKKVCEMIKQFPFVADARLEFDRADSSQLFQPPRQSAVAMVTPRENTILNRQQLQSIQRTVASSFVAVDADEVAVVDTNAGIAYDDIRGQADLIEMLHWELRQRERYEKVLHSALAPDFPGIEITVRVYATARQAKQDRDGQKPREFKLAGQTSQQTQITEAPSVGLNTTTPVTVAIPKTPRQAHQPGVQTASFEAMLPHATFEIDSAISTNSELYEERISVRIIVPNGLIACADSDGTKSQTQAACFQKLSELITARVRARLPQKVLAEPFSIEVVPREKLLSNCINRGGAIDVMALRKSWPLWAILLTGVVAALLIRGQSRSGQSSARIPGSDDGPTLDLETQLSDLIESDPVTAAKVLKNWIQNDR